MLLNILFVEIIVERKVKNLFLVYLYYLIVFMYFFEFVLVNISEGNKVYLILNFYNNVVVFRI